MSGQPAAGARDDYVLGGTSEEYERLRRQAQCWQPATRRVLEAIGLRQGMSCLDVGCGPGEVMRLMGEMVGLSGQVSGIDVDGRLGAEALRVLQAAGGSRFAFVEGEVLEIPDIGPFDVTFARFLLIHASDPAAVLRRMYAWTKPGGCLVVQDYCLDPVRLHPPLEAAAEFDRVFHAVFARAGRDREIGLKLPIHFVEAGIGWPDGTDVSGILSPLEPAGEMIQAVYRSILPKAIELGVTSEEESRRFFRSMGAALADGRPRAGLWPLVIGAWKRKPA